MSRLQPVEPLIAFLTFLVQSLWPESKNNKIINKHFDVWPLSGIFAPEQPDCTWLCAHVTRAAKVVESCAKAQKTRQVF